MGGLKTLFLEKLRAIDPRILGRKISCQQQAQRAAATYFVCKQASTQN